MKKIIAILLTALLLLAMVGCSIGSKGRTLDAISGTWHSEHSELTISGKRIERTGFYDLDGRRVAGDILAGKIKVHQDGTFTADMPGWSEEGYLKDGSTLVLGDTEYTR